MLFVLALLILSSPRLTCAKVVSVPGTSITFELPETFFHVRTRQEIGSADYRVGEPLFVDLDPEKIFFFPKTLSLSSKA